MIICNNFPFLTLGTSKSGVPIGSYNLGPAVIRGWYCGENASNLSVTERRKDSIPSATEPPSSLIMSDKGFTLSASTSINGSTEIAGNVSLGINLVANMEGSSTLSANLSLLIQLASAMSTSTSMTGSLTNIVQLASAITSGTSMTGSLGLISYMEAVLSGNTTLAADLKGTLNLEANLTPFTDLSPENLAAAVWNSVASQYNQALSMGEIINNMGSVSDPWSTILPGSYTGEQAGAIIDRLEDLIKKVKAITSAQL